MNNNKNAQGWADTDVSSFREEEFDFQKHLDKFNKAEIFAEIRVSVSLFFWYHFILILKRTRIKHQKKISSLLIIDYHKETCYQQRTYLTCL